VALVEAVQAVQRAVDVDGVAPAGFAQQGDDPLRLAQRIGADEDASLRIVVQPLQQAVDLAAGRAACPTR
jgi:hypothetical protein